MILHRKGKFVFSRGDAETRSFCRRETVKFVKSVKSVDKTVPARSSAASTRLDAWASRFPTLTRGVTIVSPLRGFQFPQFLPAAKSGLHQLTSSPVNQSTSPPFLRLRVPSCSFVVKIRSPGNGERSLIRCFFRSDAEFLFRR